MPAVWHANLVRCREPDYPPPEDDDGAEHCDGTDDSCERRDEGDEDQDDDGGSDQRHRQPPARTARAAGALPNVNRSPTTATIHGFRISKDPPARSTRGLRSRVREAPTARGSGGRIQTDKLPPGSLPGPVATRCARWGADPPDSRPHASRSGASLRALMRAGQGSPSSGGSSYLETSTTTAGRASTRIHGTDHDVDTDVEADVDTE